MKRRHLLLAGGLLLGAGLLIFGEPNGGADVAQPVARAAHPGGVADTAPPTSMASLHAAEQPDEGHLAEVKLLLLLDRQADLAVQKAAVTNTGLFAEQSWAPPPAPAAALTTAPAAPVAPPLPFLYLGRQSQDGQVDVFLAEGNKNHVAHAGSTVAGNYRVEAITPTAVSFTYLPLNQLQQLAIRASN